MEAAFSKLTKGMSLSSGISKEELKILSSSLPFPLPDDYVNFLFFSNGAEGDIGNNYLAIWRIEDLVSRNKACSVESCVLGLFLFGSDGGGEAYGFDYRGEKTIIVNVPFIGMNWKTAIKKGDNFLDFLKNQYDE